MGREGSLVVTAGKQRGWSVISVETRAVNGEGIERERERVSESTTHYQGRQARIVEAHAPVTAAQRSNGIRDHIG